MKEKINKISLCIIWICILIGVHLQAGFFTALAIGSILLYIYYDRKNMLRVAKILKDLTNLIT